MHSSKKKIKLLLLDPAQNHKIKPKVTFDQCALATKNNHLNLYDLRNQKSNENDAQRRRSTIHFKLPSQEDICERKTYKFSDSMRKNKKIARFKNLWITKRGTRNFYIMENQDFVLIDEKNKDYRLYAILDGHGKYGRMIAQTVATKLANKYLIDQKSILKENSQSINENVMKNAILETHKYICQQFPKEVSNSGCTLLTVLIRGNKIYCFNVGGSRAVMAIKDSENKTLIPFPLSSEHNLSRFDQKNRIFQTNAVIEQLKDENGCRIGPQRIWRKGERYPGVYITRSLGMKMSSDLGIIPLPQSICLEIKSNYEFILVCSDGFWEVFTNQQAIQEVAKHWKNDKLQEGIQLLMDQAVQRWDKKSQLMDDISILIIRV